MSSTKVNNVISLSELKASLKEQSESKKFKSYLKSLNDQDLLNIAKSLNSDDKEIQILELKKLLKESSQLIEEVNHRIDEDHLKFKEELTGIHKNLLEKLTKL